MKNTYLGKQGPKCPASPPVPQPGSQAWPRRMAQNEYHPQISGPCRVHWLARPRGEYERFNGNNSGNQSFC